MKKIIVKIIMLVTLISVVMVILYLGFFEKNISVSAERNYIVYSIDRFPDNLNNSPQSDLSKEDFLFLLFDGLVYEDKDGKILPQISDKWEVSDDGISYNFHIRDDAFWSNGDKIVAKDFKDFFISLIRNNETTYMDNISNVVGVSDYLKGTGDEKSIAIEAVDQSHLKITLCFPNDDFLNILAEPCFLLRHNEEELDNWGEKYNDINYSGAFVIEEFNKAKQIKLSYNKYYWDNENIRENEMIIKEDYSSEDNYVEYLFGMVDIIRGFPKMESQKLQEQNEITKVPTKEKKILIYNVGENKFFRSYRDRILLDTFMSNINNSDEKTISSEDIENNNRDTENKEYAEGEENPQVGNKIKIIYYEKNILSKDENTEFMDLAVKIKEFLKKNNLEVNIEKVEDKLQLEETLNKGDFDLFITKDVIDEDNKSFYMKWVSDSFFNRFGYINNYYDNALKNYIASEDINEKISNINKAKEILDEDKPFTIIEETQVEFSQKSYVEGVTYNSRGNLYLKYAYIKESELTRK
ncbi:ABC transporter substrate-binding protein [Clostridium grantii]|uniref:Peptide/nickel transport system substrate-binding protein n=1 Tax=Clostridium grantii DSM 8605 TaxID=1121316 RepID=A0A1M5XEL1_9CLOT|nr:ABC transporter substrate-binding protein [Clostridium grantii]SHH98092.1 peptide/nickel transport system substrate-binding protein [Clostridium grantii DSM 8605]